MKNSEQKFGQERGKGSGRDTGRDFELIRAFEYVDDQYLDIVEQERAPRAKKHTVKWKRHIGRIAACIAALILALSLPVLAIAANWFGLRDWLLPSGPGEPSSAEPFTEEESSVFVKPSGAESAVPEKESAVPEAESQSVISLAGSGGVAGVSRCL